MFQIILVKILVRLVALFQFGRFRYSQPVEANFKYMTFLEKMRWGYKALIRQVEKGEKGKGIEAFFDGQDLDFTPDPGFRPEHRVILTTGGDLSATEVATPETTVHLWDEVEQFYFAGDIICANLEAPLDPSRSVSGVPRICLTAPDMNTSPAMFERFTAGGRGPNLFSTINNHSLDQGETGLIATLDFLDTKGVPHVGTARTPAEQREILIIEKNGIRTAFIAYTFSLNRYDPLPGKPYMTNLIRLNLPDPDLSLIKEHVNIARSKGADFVVAMLHWSIEFETYPVMHLIQTGHRILELGVDVILGHHPHVAQPLEKYTYTDPVSGKTREGLIAYSLGELVSYNAFSKNSRLAFLVRLEITKGIQDGLSVTLLTGLKVLPIYTLVRQDVIGQWEYRLLDFRKTLADLENGRNTYGLRQKEIKELRRLERLLYDKLLPEKTKGILYDGN